MRVVVYLPNLLQLAFNFSHKYFSFARCISAGRPLREHIVTGSAGNNMKMQMVNNLTRSPAIIAQNIVPVRSHSRYNSAGDFTEPIRNLAQKLSRTAMHPLDVLARYHQRMAFADRPNIKERNNHLILVDPGGRYLGGVLRCHESGLA